MHRLSFSPFHTLSFWGIGELKLKSYNNINQEREYHNLTQGAAFHESF
jgi:hypothetical protein